MCIFYLLKRKAHQFSALFFLVPVHILSQMNENLCNLYCYNSLCKTFSFFCVFMIPAIVACMCITYKACLCLCITYIGYLYPFRVLCLRWAKLRTINILSYITCNIYIYILPLRYKQAVLPHEIINVYNRNKYI